MRPPRCFNNYIMFHHVHSLFTHSVIEKGRRLFELSYRDGIKSMGDKTGIVVGAMKCIGG